ncbi:MAG: hypothetical protein IPK13_27190 [Deltaproteobacteria bacterium]|nr:hypothetical protein [Deltaproteobacteria bacterium]
MRARYAISNIAAIGRPGRCGPVSYALDARRDRRIVGLGGAPLWEGAGVGID